MLTLTLFGATGDLARRKLFPALQQLAAEDRLPTDFLIQAIGRRPYTTEQFLTQIPPVPDLASHVSYIEMDITQPDGYAQLVTRPGQHIFYLAIEPTLLEVVVQNLARLPVASDPLERRIALEKPFGSDLVSAQALDRLLAASFQEEQLFRLDHYLGKETVQNLLAFRFANSLSQAVWDREHIDHIQIVVAEAEGIGTRGSFYDATGAVRDFLQNHIMQLVSLLLMEQPTSLTFAALADAAFAVIDQLYIDESDVVLGQYQGYLLENKIPIDSLTETFVAVKLQSRDPRWKDVPIYVRTGKGLERRVSEIAIQLRQPEQTLFANEQSNRLVFRIQPDEGIELQLSTKAVGAPEDLQPVSIQFCYESLGQRLPEAYERLFQDLFTNRRIFMLRSDVIEASWKLIDPLREEHSGKVPFGYPIGSWGPLEADQLIKQDGRHWYLGSHSFCNGIQVMHSQ